MTEKYENALFQKAMGLYAERQSKIILEENKKLNSKNEIPVNKEDIYRLFDETVRKSRRYSLFRTIRKIASFAAIFAVVVVFVFAAASVTYAAVTKSSPNALYRIIFEDNRLYTKIRFDGEENFSGSYEEKCITDYAPVYIPDGFTLSKKTSSTLFYENGSKKIYIDILDDSGGIINTENADKIRYLKIGDGVAMLVVRKNDNICFVSMSVRNTLMLITGIRTEPDELIKIAKSIK